MCGGWSMSRAESTWEKEKKKKKKPNLEKQKRNKI